MVLDIIVLPSSIARVQTGHLEDETKLLLNSLVRLQLLMQLSADLQWKTSPYSLDGEIFTHLRCNITPLDGIMVPQIYHDTISLNETNVLLTIFAKYQLDGSSSIVADSLLFNNFEHKSVSIIELV